LEKSQTPNPIVAVGAVRFGNALPLALIAGPCALENRAHALEMAIALKEMCARVGIGLVYKTSFDKATAPRQNPRAASASMRRCRYSPRSATRSKSPCSPTCMTQPNASAPRKPPMFCKFLLS